MIPDSELADLTRFGRKAAKGFRGKVEDMRNELFFISLASPSDNERVVLRL
jgi:hypothetical protein